MIEKLSENTAVFQQIHKRIWPSAQRDTCFISHIRQLGKDDNIEKTDKEIGSPWTVQNISMEHEKVAVRQFFFKTLLIRNVILLYYIHILQLTLYSSQVDLCLIYVTCTFQRVQNITIGRKVFVFSLPFHSDFELMLLSTIPKCHSWSTSEFMDP